MPQTFFTSRSNPYEAIAGGVQKLGDIASSAVQQYQASKASADHVTNMKAQFKQALQGAGKQLAGLTDQEVQQYQSRIDSIQDPTELDRQVYDITKQLDERAKTYKASQEQQAQQQKTLGVTQGIAKTEAGTPAQTTPGPFAPPETPVAAGRQAPIVSSLMTEKIPKEPQPTPEPAQYGQTTPAVAGRRVTAEQAQMKYSEVGAEPDKALIEQKRIADVEAEKLKRAELTAKARKYADDLRAKSADARNAIARASAARSAKGASAKAADDYLNKLKDFTALKISAEDKASKIENDGGDATELRNEIIKIDEELNNLRATTTNVTSPYEKTVNTPKPEDPLGFF
jgi:hypothetical protein